MAADPRDALDTGRRLGRVDSFSDGLFAIAATLLALSIDVPSVPEARLDSTLDTLIPSVTAYFISFAVVGLFWLRHHEFFGRLRASDSRLAVINLVFLSFVALLPVPTQLLGRYDNSASPVVIYAGMIIVLSLLLHVLIRHAERGGLMEEGAERVSDPVGLGGILLAFGASIPVSLVNPDWGMYCWILAAVLPALIVRARRGPAG